MKNVFQIFSIFEKKKKKFFHFIISYQILQIPFNFKRFKKK
jgi:hypothetical protein